MSFWKSIVARAMYTRDLGFIQMLLALGHDVNEQDVDLTGNALVHIAVLMNSLEMLELLVQQVDVDLDVRNFEGDTPLLLCMKRNQPDSASLVRCLIRAGCNVCLADNAKVAPIHRVMSREGPELDEILTREEIDVNVQDWRQFTPLNYAIQNRNLYGLMELLRRGANVNTRCINNTTLLTYSMADSRMMIIVHQALIKENPSDLSIIEKEININHINKRGEHVLNCAMALTKPHYFELIWSKMDPRSLLRTEPSFLYSYLSLCNFNDVNDWLRCLWLMLESKIAIDLLNSSKHIQMLGLLTFLLPIYENKSLDSDSRSKLLSKFVSLKVKVNLEDVMFAASHFGYNGPEFKILLFACDNFKNLPYIRDYKTYIPYPLFKHHLGLQETMTFASTYQLLISYVEMEYEIENIMYAMKFFSLPLYWKDELIDHCRIKSKYREQFVKSVGDMPQFPSLLELSRNQAIMTIQKTNRYSHPADFYRIVYSLGLPKRVENLMLFNTPLH